MRENETRIGGHQWGLFSIFEPVEPKTNRVIDQSVAAWQIASMKTGGSAFENPRSAIQRAGIMAGGSNRQNLPPQIREYIAQMSRMISEPPPEYRHLLDHRYAD